jgi:hypothetical protein
MNRSIVSPRLREENETKDGAKNGTVADKSKRSLYFLLRQQVPGRAVMYALAE